MCELAELKEVGKWSGWKSIHRGVLVQCIDEDKCNVMECINTVSDCVLVLSDCNIETAITSVLGMDMNIH